MELDASKLKKNHSINLDMLFQCKNINLLLNSDLRGENIYGFLEPHRQLHKNFVEI
jgi:hypothetical protein